MVGSGIGDRSAVIKNQVVALGAKVSRLRVPVGAGVFGIEQAGVLEHDRAVVPTCE